MKESLDFVILGLSITSSWGNGHATTYRGLVRGLAARGHRVLFLERDTEWYAGNRDEPRPRGARVELYRSLDELRERFERAVADADVVIVGSFVPEGALMGEWVTGVARGVTAFYDIDTPVTLGKLEEGGCDYITENLVRRYHLYLSFSGGPVLPMIERRFGAQRARALYCSVDPELYRPERHAQCRWDLGYLGTYSDDRQPALDALLLEPARRWPRGAFAVAGPMYPESIEWPDNVFREIHLSPREHPGFYSAQRFTLNITRQAMKQLGYSPSVRLFEASACAAPIISDWWEGLDSIFAIGAEVLIAESAEDTLRFLRDCPAAARAAMGEAARRRVLREHTPEQRAQQLESYIRELHDNDAADTARTQRSGRAADHGLASGMAAERGGSEAGGGAVAAPGAKADPGSVRQSAGARL